jgi:hypothetical protein
MVLRIVVGVLFFIMSDSLMCTHDVNIWFLLSPYKADC